jgi:hypothetical protein
MEHRYCPLAVEMVQGKHCDFSTYLAKRAKAQSGAWAEVHFPDYGTVLWSPDSRNYSRKTLRFQHLSYEESESSLWRMSEVKFPDYGTLLCSPGSRDCSRKAGKHCDFSTKLTMKVRA